MSVDYLWRARYLPSVPRSVTEWRWIPGYEGVYRVSNQGGRRLTSTTTGPALPPRGLGRSASQT